MSDILLGGFSNLSYDESYNVNGGFSFAGLIDRFNDDPLGTILDVWANPLSTAKDVINTTTVLVPNSNADKFKNMKRPVLPFR